MMYLNQNKASDTISVEGHENFGLSQETVEKFAGDTFIAKETT